MITEPGTNLILSENKNTTLLDSIFKRIDISANIHNSKGIAITGHYDCVGNPSSKNEQMVHLKKSADVLKKKYPNHLITALWIDENFEINEVTL